MLIYLLTSSVFAAQFYGNPHMNVGVVPVAMQPLACEQILDPNFCRGPAMETGYICSWQENECEAINPSEHKNENEAAEDPCKMLSNNQIACQAKPGCHFEELECQMGDNFSNIPMHGAFPNQPVHAQPPATGGAIPGNFSPTANTHGGHGIFPIGMAPFPNGMPANGMPPNGMPPNGMPPNGMPPNGMPPNGMLPNGMLPNGMLPNGMPPNGMPPNGMPPNGMPPNGMPPNGMPPNGMPPNGMPPATHGMPPAAANGMPPAHGMAMPPAHGMAMPPAHGMAMPPAAANGMPPTGSLPGVFPLAGTNPANFNGYPAANPYPPATPQTNPYPPSTHTQPAKPANSHKPAAIVPQECTALVQLQCFGPSTITGDVCMWDAEDGECVASAEGDVEALCGQFGVPALCMANEVCFWDEVDGECAENKFPNQFEEGEFQMPVFTSLCSKSHDVNSCAAQAKCFWDDVAGTSAGTCVDVIQAQNVCRVLNTAQHCSTNMFCHWRQNKCLATAGLQAVHLPLTGSQSQKAVSTSTWEQDILVGFAACVLGLSFGLFLSWTHSKWTSAPERMSNEDYRDIMMDINSQRLV